MFCSCIGDTHKPFNALRHLLLAVHTLEETHIGAGLDGLLQPVNGSIETQRLQRIRTCDNHNVPVDAFTSGIRRADARQECRFINQLLTAEMAAPLREHLVLEMQACNAGQDVAFDLGGFSLSLTLTYSIQPGMGLLIK